MRYASHHHWVLEQEFYEKGSQSFKKATEIEYIERSSDFRSTGRASVPYVPIDTRFGNDLLQSFTVEGDLH